MHHLLEEHFSVCMYVNKVATDSLIWYQHPAPVLAILTVCLVMSPTAARCPADDYLAVFYSLWLLHLLGSKEHARKWPSCPKKWAGRTPGHHQDTLLWVLGKYLASSLISSVLRNLLCEKRTEPLASVFNPFIPIVRHVFYKGDFKTLIL